MAIGAQGHPYLLFAIHTTHFAVDTRQVERVTAMSLVDNDRTERIYFHEKVRFLKPLGAYRTPVVLIPSGGGEIGIVVDHVSGIGHFEAKAHRSVPPLMQRVENLAVYRGILLGEGGKHHFVVDLNRLMQMADLGRDMPLPENLMTLKSGFSSH